MSSLRNFLTDPFVFQTASNIAKGILGDDLNILQKVLIMKHLEKSKPQVIEVENLVSTLSRYILIFSFIKNS